MIGCRCLILLRRGPRGRRSWIRSLYLGLLLLLLCRRMGCNLHMNRSQYGISFESECTTSWILSV